MVIGYIFWGLVAMVIMAIIAAMILFLIAHPEILWIGLAVVVAVLLIEATRR